MNRLLIIATVALLITSTASAQENSNDIVGIDQFGRSFGTISGYREGRTVGLFFWPWIGQPYASGIYDASKLIQLPDGKDVLFKIGYVKKDEQGNELSPTGQAHYWGEPLWGYYNSDDEWVIRKQMQMLTLAGVDFIFWDHTNAVTYDNVVLKVAKVIQEMRDEGWAAPSMVSYTHSHSIATIRHIYESFYQNDEFPDVWFRIDGKPVVIGYDNIADDLAEAASRNDTSYKPEPLSREILDYFHFWKADWPCDETYPDGFTWVEWKYPQPYHEKSQMMNVTVASHPAVPMSFSLTHENWGNWGRGYDPETKKNISENAEKGSFFQLQWDRAIEFDPPIISVGGWNEWIAYKQPWGGEEMLCDATSMEYSRDIEPMKGGYEDAFFLQLISNIRRYKANNEKRLTPPLSIDIKGPDSQWDKASFIQRHPDAKQIARDAFGGAKTVRYTQAAPVNALTEVRVSYDSKNIYFLLKMQKEITEGVDRINIYVGTGEPSIKGWEGYEYVIGGTDGKKMKLAKLSSDRSETPAGKCRYILSGNTMQVEVPRAILNLDNAEGFYFKVSSDIDDPSDIMSTYTSGSAMPMGRLSYQLYF